SSFFVNLFKNFYKYLIKKPLRFLFHPAQIVYRSNEGYVKLPFFSSISRSTKWPEIDQDPVKISKNIMTVDRQQLIPMIIGSGFEEFRDCGLDAKAEDDDIPKRLAFIEKLKTKIQNLPPHDTLLEPLERQREMLYAKTFWVLASEGIREAQIEFDYALYQLRSKDPQKQPKILPYLNLIHYLTPNLGPTQKAWQQKQRIKLLSKSPDSTWLENFGENQPSLTHLKESIESIMLERQPDKVKLNYAINSIIYLFQQAYRQQNLQAAKILSRLYNQLDHQKGPLSSQIGNLLALAKNLAFGSGHNEEDLDLVNLTERLEKLTLDDWFNNFKNSDNRQVQMAFKSLKNDQPPFSSIINWAIFTLSREEAPHSRLSANEIFFALQTLYIHSIYPLKVPTNSNPAFIGLLDALKSWESDEMTTFTIQSVISKTKDIIISSVRRQTLTQTELDEFLAKVHPDPQPLHHPHPESNHIHNSPEPNHQLNSQTNQNPNSELNHEINPQTQHEPNPQSNQN
ncbi:hypothetical protein O181_103577, partial [Austropuccinia psidii MF-1]|nr:hypothetical protein [Austropuccinia psidii MF-1]